MGKHKTYDCGPQCVVEHALEPLIGKWKGSIVFLIRNRSIRFNSLATMLPGVSTRILAKQLKELEDDGLINRKVLSEKPLAVEYSLTSYGKDLLPIISSLINWRGRVSEPTRVYRRVKHSKDEPYDEETIHPRLSGRTSRTRCSAVSREPR